MQGDARKHLFRGRLAENTTADSYELSFFQLTNTIVGHSEELPHFLLTGSRAAKAKKSAARSRRSRPLKSRPSCYYHSADRGQLPPPVVIPRNGNLVSREMLIEFN